MFTDIVGYTSLMGESEKKAFETINTNREIHQQLTEKYQGRIVKELGDGLLTVFENGTDAVICAIEIQKEAKDKNILLRIGLHEGEVIFENDDVFGDGVNIASRIQAEAAPGGICISDTVFRIIRNKENLQAEFLGKRILKNVRDPLQLYQLKTHGLQTRRVSDARKLKWWIAPIVGIVCLIIGFYLNAYFKGRSEIQEIQRFSINVPEEIPVGMIGEGHFRIGQKAIAISPDGKTIVYVGERNGSTQLYKRDINSYEVSPLPGTEGAYFPFFSPDGNWIAFFTRNHLKRVNFLGNDPIIICEVVHPYGGTWSKSDTIYFVNEEGNNLSRVSVEGGKSMIIVKGKLSNYVNPYILPDDEHILFNSAENEILAVSNKSLKVTHILDEGLDPRYVEPGYLIYNQRERIMAVGLDMEKLAIAGKPFIIHDNVRVESMSLQTQFDISKNGTLVYVEGECLDLGKLMLVDNRGMIRDTLSLIPNYYGSYKISPDGKKLAYTVFEDLENSSRIANLYIVDLERNIPNPIDEDVYMFVCWYSDSKTLAYLKKNTDGFLDLFNRSENTGNSERIWSLPFTEGAINQITQDNKYIFSNFFSGSSQHLYMLNLDEKDTIRLTNDPASDQFGPFLSLNGKYLIYVSTETGQYDLFCMPFPSTGQKWRITTNGAESYKLSSIDNKVYLRSIDVRKMMVVNLDFSNGFDFDGPHLLWEGDYLDIPGPSFDLSPNDEYFLMKKSVVETHTTIKIHVITNFIEEIKQKEALGK
jgi:Tol biopolymer transport system component